MMPSSPGLLHNFQRPRPRQPPTPRLPLSASSRARSRRLSRLVLHHPPTSSTPPQPPVLASRAAFYCLTPTGIAPSPAVSGIIAKSHFPPTTTPPPLQSLNSRATTWCHLPFSTPARSHLAAPLGNSQIDRPAPRLPALPLPSAGSLAKYTACLTIAPVCNPTLSSARTGVLLTARDIYPFRPDTAVIALPDQYMLCSG
ncbi:hypothetical protein B0J12DRAFT_375631 [Macrophomina phaseolina]|uniref:Uncharacterized protein n=1 Tax=Macrophomina phaseolina TaxID=35725 RepID=A0ABQ8GKA9_9PEZI|nr:hypothetical protein B0J12DRAFT_375631 [Macrophomina phaseolina]